MKQKDVAMILIVAFVSAAVAFVVSNWLFGGQKAGEQTTEIIDVISDDFSQPPEKYFNANAVNPTKLIEIGGESNPSPFGNNGE